MSSGASPRPFLRGLRDQEEGQVLLLGIGLVAVVLALLLVVASATAVYLDLKRLTSLADSAAAAAAQAVDAETYYGGGRTGDPVSALALTDAAVQQSAAEHLAAQVGSGGLTGVRITSASTPEGSGAVVTLTAHSQPPFLPWGVIPAEGFTLTVTGSAQGVATSR